MCISNKFPDAFHAAPWECHFVNTVLIQLVQNEDAEQSEKSRRVSVRIPNANTFFLLCFKPLRFYLALTKHFNKEIGREIC